MGVSLKTDTIERDNTVYSNRCVTDIGKTIKPFCVPSCGRCLNKIEINKYLRVQELHDIPHMVKERMYV